MISFTIIVRPNVYNNTALAFAEIMNYTFGYFRFEAFDLKVTTVPISYKENLRV